MGEDRDQAVLDALAAAWNGFVKLEPTHPDDTDDFRRAIHECQRIMGLRQLRRDDPDRWPTHGGGISHDSGASSGNSIGR